MGRGFDLLHLGVLSDLLSDCYLAEFFKVARNTL